MGRSTRVNSVMSQQDRIDLLEKRIAYLEDRLRRWDWVDAQIRKRLLDRTPEGIDGDSLSSSAPMGHSRVSVKTPGLDTCTGVALAIPLNTLLTGNSLS